MTDVDECDNNNGNCHSQAKCTNTPGSFTCTCLDGYYGDGITCSGVLRLFYISPYFVNFSGRKKRRENSLNLIKQIKRNKKKKGEDKLKPQRKRDKETTRVRTGSSSRREEDAV